MQADSKLAVYQSGAGNKLTCNSQQWEGRIVIRDYRLCGADCRLSGNVNLCPIAGSGTSTKLGTRL